MNGSSRIESMWRSKVVIACSSYLTSIRYPILTRAR
jgi:hypothetical protein